MEPAFPDIFVAYASDKPTRPGRGWLGRAQLDRVTILWDGKEWMQRGSFYITINDYFVARGEAYSDPNDWAGTIAHEMLHNLGHTHPHSDDPDWDKYQINVVDEMVQTLGVGYKGSSGTLFSRHDCQNQDR